MRRLRLLEALPPMLQSAGALAMLLAGRGGGIGEGTALPFLLQRLGWPEHLAQQHQPPQRPTRGEQPP
jgi:hypothetical protein